MVKVAMTDRAHRAPQSRQRSGPLPAREGTIIGGRGYVGSVEAARQALCLDFATSWAHSLAAAAPIILERTTT